MIKIIYATLLSYAFFILVGCSATNDRAQFSYGNRPDLILFWDHPKKTSQCAGFFVSPSVIYTAQHCIASSATGAYGVSGNKEFEIELSSSTNGLNEHKYSLTSIHTDKTELRTPEIIPVPFAVVDEGFVYSKQFSGYMAIGKDIVRCEFNTIDHIKKIALSTECPLGHNLSGSAVYKDKDLFTVIGMYHGYVFNSPDDHDPKHVISGFNKE